MKKIAATLLASFAFLPQVHAAEPDQCRNPSFSDVGWTDVWVDEDGLGLERNTVKVGIMEARSVKDLGIAGVTAAVLASNGAAWGLATGVILCLVVYGRDFFRGEPDATFKAMLRAQEGQAAES